MSFMIWTSTLTTYYKYKGCAHALELYKGGQGYSESGFGCKHYYGASIRPVCPKD